MPNQIHTIKKAEKLKVPNIIHAKHNTFKGKLNYYCINGFKIKQKIKSPLLKQQKKLPKVSQIQKHAKYNTFTV